MEGFDEEVEDWIEELIEHDTFENREDIYEFCVYAVKKFCEANSIGFDDEEEKEKYLENNYIPIRLTEANADGGTWKEFLDDNKDVTKIELNISEDAVGVGD